MTVGTDNGNKKGEPRKAFSAVMMVAIMLFSTQMYSFQDFEKYDEEESVWGDVAKRTAFQQIGQAEGPMPGGSQGQPAAENPFQHEHFLNPSYHDPMSVYGQVSDPSALNLDSSYGFFLEETNAEDHDNDGIDDLNDLDDDNDGINDLIEMFDGCIGTHQFDHDNDGVLDEFDWDDDNDGILEGPIDYSQGADPRNVSMDRYVEPTTVHPWTGTPVGVGYRVDQNPMDHDNDGVTDDDTDGAGPDSYDEDDDNDARIDQFVWPCDFDQDGIQDYFDDDDDNDGVVDLWDENPWDSLQYGNISTSATLWDDARVVANTSYMDYVGGVDFVEREKAWHPKNGTQAFTEIFDGDLDGDGIPNFLDPDNDNDGTPDSADTDDDNDGLADMYDAVSYTHLTLPTILLV